jgi:hypothetical protein
MVISQNAVFFKQFLVSYQQAFLLILLCSNVRKLPVFCREVTRKQEACRIVMIIVLYNICETLTGADEIIN